MAKRIQVVTNRQTRGNVAMRAYKVTEPTNVKIEGVNPIPVVKVTDADLIENGGDFKLGGNNPIAYMVYETFNETPHGGPAIPIYIVNDAIAFIGAYDSVNNIVHVYEIARRTLSSYEGNLVTIRRTSDNAEMAFTYDENGLLDTAAINTWLGGSSGKVVTINDQIGGDDVTQAIAANQLDYIASGQNGNPTMGFDGVSMFIQGVFSAPLTQPYTIYATASLDATVVNDDLARYILDGDDAVNRNILGKLDTPAPDGWHIFAGNNVTGDAADSNFNIWSALFNSSESNFWINGNIQ